MLTILTGTNDYMRKKALATIVDAFLKEHGDMGYETIDGETASYSRIRDAVASPPFLVEQKLVVVTGLSANKELAEKAESLFGELADTTHLIVFEGRLDKRVAYYKLLKKQKNFNEFNELDENGLAGWAFEEAKSLGGELRLTDARYLIDRSRASQLALRHEIEKLVAFSPHITKESIDALVDKAPASSIFDLLDAALSGNAAKALALYEDQRQQRVEPQQILAMLAWQVHIMALVKTAGQKSSAEIAKHAGVSPYVATKTQSLVRSLSVADIKALVARLLSIDIRLKSQPIDADSALKNFILSV